MTITATTTTPLMVASQSRPTKVAGAIAGMLREQEIAYIDCIGAAAVNQAVKSIAIAQKYLHEDGISICCVPSFEDTDIDGELRTAMRFTVYRNHH